MLGRHGANQAYRVKQLRRDMIPKGWLDHALRDKQHDEADLTKFGVEIVTRLCERLFELGAPGLHFYTLNRWGASFRICANLGFD